MLVTDRLTPGETLAELLDLRGVEIAETVRFRDLGHDRDLCPGFRERVAALLGSYLAYRTDVQDTQGMRDEGIDVHLYYQLDGTRRVGLQVKSFDEIDKWATGKDPAFMMRLKAQVSTALNKVKVEDYYVLLCTDESVHRNNIRLIASELAMFERVKLVGPRQALALFELSDEQVAARVTQLLCEGDPLLADARDEAARMKPDLAFFRLNLMAMACEGRKEVDDEVLFDLEQEWAELQGGRGPKSDRLSELVSELDGRGYDYGVAGGDTLFITGFPSSWLALYFDQRHRGTGDALTKLGLLLDITPHCGRPRRRSRRRV